MSGFLQVSCAGARLPVRTHVRSWLKSCAHATRGRRAYSRLVGRQGVARSREYRLNV
jgi:hypothetical protein